MFNKFFSVLLVLAVFLVISNSAMAALPTNEPVIIAFGEPGQEQMPVIYVHGWADDGAGWGRGTGEGCYGPAGDEPPSPSSFLHEADIENWAVQWWSNNNGAPESTSDEGYAFLVTGQELIDQSSWIDAADDEFIGSSIQNRPCPSALDQLKKNRFADVPHLFIRNTYNDSGRVLDHARDLRDLLLVERSETGKFASYSQINIVTHSKGSLVTRSLLSMLAQESRGEYEFVSNVIYNAPPFGGSSVAELAARVFALPEATLADVIDDPLFLALFGTDPNRSMKDALTEFLDMTLILMGHSNGLDDVRNLLPPGSLLALELLEPFSLNNLPAIPFYDPATRLMLSAVRHLVTNFSGFPAEPALSDLSMSSAAERLVTYPTSPFSKQFVTGGDWALANTTLFPCAMVGATLPCADDIGNDPSLLYNLPSLTLTGSDGVVAVGSSQLLTETGEFGEQMQRLDIINAWHGDLTDPQKIGEKWLQVLLAAPTDMILQGSVVANTAARSYLVSSATTFRFLSATVTKPSQPAGTEVTVAAARHEYRVVIVAPEDSAENNTVTDWVTLALGETVLFSDLRNTYDLSNKTFYVQWRSINTTGGREMIRRAYFAIDQGAPIVVEENILAANSAEVYKRNSANRILDIALRADFFTLASHPLLSMIEQNQEAKWVVRNPDNKALTFSLNARGSFVYRWNNDNLDSAQAEATSMDALGALVTLQELSDGLHTLYYQLNSLTETGPLQSTTVFVDNSPPEVEIICEGVASFLCLVGPTTPLQFTVHDLESNGGTGTIAIDGYPGGVIPPGRQFTLAETNLKTVGQAAGAVGVVVPLTVNARDLVSNTLAETLEIYYDWTAPEVIIENVGGLPIEGGYRVFANQVSIEVSLDSANGGAEAPRAQIIPVTGGAMSSAIFQLNGNGRYAASIQLQPGENRIIIASSDIVGNVGSQEIMVNYSEAPFDQAPLTLLSNRVQDTCYNVAGDEVNCTSGSIDNVFSDYYGKVAIFDSRSNRFVANDTNGRIDVFVWRDGVLTRGNTTITSEQANGDSKAKAMAGNGRYLYFSSTADNLIAGTDNGNLYVKDLQTGELAVISRHFSGTPINRFAEQFEATTTFNGRYVFFSSRKADYIENFDNTSNAQGIYMVDLDPDGNADFFDDNYVTYAISNINNATMANDDSQLPSVSSDGRYLAFRTAATDLHADLANNGNTRDILLLKFSGNANDGTLDTSVANRVVVPIAFDAHYPKVGPDDDTVVFSTRLNLLAVDNNNAALDTDIYMSLGEGSGSGNVSNRSLELVSLGFDGTASSSFNNGLPVQNVFIANEPGLSDFAKKAGWVSAHDNIVANDNNAAEDLFIYRVSDVFPENLAVPNWITDDLPSAATVQTGAMSADGRFAFWVNRQQYITPYEGDAETHLFRRRIEPLRETLLTLSVNGNGSVQRVTSGDATTQANQFSYQDDDRVTLTALPDVGWRFVDWQQVDSQSENSAIVDMYSHREVIVNFVAASPPYAASVSLLTDEDQSSEAVTPSFSDDDIGDTHVFSIVQQATNGVATIQDNRLRYTPNPDFNGNDSFAFQITDSFGLSLVDAAVAEVIVNPINDAPLTTSLNIETEKGNTSALVVPEVSDIDVDDSFSLELLIPGLNGSVEIIDNAIRYIPAIDFVGNDSFSYNVIDSGGLNVVGIASVKVNDSVVENTESKKDSGFFGALTYELLLFIAMLMLFSRMRWIRLLINK